MLNQIGDPDYYYHVALSKQILAQGAPPETVPQIRGIGWDILFTDKEFLFHIVTTIFYGLFGEIGVRAVPVVCSIISYALLFCLSLTQVGKNYFWLPLLLLAADPHFLYRMIMVRPQTLAVTLFIALLVALLYKRKYLVLTFSALFVLSYHAIQIPMIVAAVAFFTLSPKDQERKVCMTSILIGVIVGILLNPYFPGTLSIVPQIFRIVMGTQGQPDLRYGGELYPWKANELLNQSLLSFATLLWGLYFLGRAPDRKTDGSATSNTNLKLMLALGIIFFAVSMMTPRGREYLMPCLVLLAIMLIHNSQEEIWEPIFGGVLGNRFHNFFFPGSRLVVTSLLILAFAQGFLVRHSYGLLWTTSTDTQSSELFKSIAKIDKNEKAHVYNCNWSQTPQIMYFRPNLTFIDLLDPSFLFYEAHQLHTAREESITNKFIDDYVLMKSIFHAQYYYCDDYDKNKRLDSDPRFQRLYPDQAVSLGDDPVALFRLIPEDQNTFFVRHFEFRIPTDPDGQWTSLNPQLQVSNDKNVPLKAMDYFDFNRHLTSKELRKEVADIKPDKPDEKQMVANCVNVRIPSAEMQKGIGKSILGIGGGPSIRLWVNEVPIYESEGEPAAGAIIQTLIPLERPLAKTDAIRLMVCPSTKQITYFGLALSLWTPEEIDHVCREKGGTHSISRLEKMPWRFKGETLKTCLAPFAARRQWAH